MTWTREYNREYSKTHHRLYRQVKEFGAVAGVSHDDIKRVWDAILNAKIVAARMKGALTFALEEIREIFTFMVPGDYGRIVQVDRRRGIGYAIEPREEVEVPWVPRMRVIPDAPQKQTPAISRVANDPSITPVPLNLSTAAPPPRPAPLAPQRQVVRSKRVVSPSPLVLASDETTSEGEDIYDIPLHVPLQHARQEYDQAVLSCFCTSRDKCDCGAEAEIRRSRVKVENIRNARLSHLREVCARANAEIQQLKVFKLD